MSPLDGFRVLQLGPGLAAAVCGRLFADAGATVSRIGADRMSPLSEHLNRGPDGSEGDRDAADLIVCEGSPERLRRAGYDATSLRHRHPQAAIVLIAPFGQTGPRAEDPASDLTLSFASGIARMLTGQVDDLREPPLAPVGHQSAFIGGVAAACAGMHAVAMRSPAVIDVSIQEALATLAITELARAGQTGASWSRRRVGDGNGATVCILPARDGYAAISPREEKQWASWLTAMGSPDWGRDPRFATKPDRVRNWDALHALMSAWSHQHDKQWIADMAQAAHVPSFPLREPAEQLGAAQLAHRGFFGSATIAGRPVRVPGSPFGVSLNPAAAALPAAGALPLAGLRVLDFSWVIAGPTATRYLAAMGADVIKIEAPGRGDPGRASDLHTVLGQGKKAIVLDLKQPEAVTLARSLASKSHIILENFATGVMDRLGLDPATLQAANPGLIHVSASGLGRTGPEASAVAYGTLLQCYAGFAGLNRHPGQPPRVGMAWLDPMCGLMLAFGVAAAVWRRRRSGQGTRIDFSMIEAMLWTMAEPLLAAQLGQSPSAQGRVFRCRGEDAWVSVGVDDIRPAPDQDAAEAAAALLAAGVPAAALAGSTDLVADPHLRTRGFWMPHRAGVVPGLPWRASFGQVTGPAPALGADTDAVLQTVLGLSGNEIQRLRTAGVIR